MQVIQCDVCKKIIPKDPSFVTAKKSKSYHTVSFDLCLKCYEKIEKILFVEEDACEEVSK